MRYLRIFIPAVLAVLLLISASPARAQEDSAKARKELERIQKELKGVKKKTTETEKKERSVLDEIDRMDRSLAQKRRELAAAQKDLDGVTGNISVTEADILATKMKLGVKKSDLSSRLTAMYKTSKAGGSWALLLSGGSDTMMKRYKYLSVMSDRDKRKVDEYSDTIDTLHQQHDHLATQKVSYEKLKVKRDSEARAVQSEEANKKKLLASIKKQKASYLAMQKELEDSGSRMMELIKRLEHASKSKPQTPGHVPSGGKMKAGLEWPVNGKVISRFGKQKHPDYDTYIYKKGIELQAELGEGVKAVDGAEVVFADWFKGLGLVAILRHPGEYYTVYAHLADVKVRTGDKVSRGQVIASVGDTGAPSGPSLYFEIRKGSDAVDPLKWLRPR